MAITMLVVAPNVPGEAVMELSRSLSKEFKTSVATDGNYGVGGKGPAVWKEAVSDLVAKLDSVHFWAIVRLSLSPLIVRAGNEVLDRLTERAVDWAVKHARAGKKAKIQLYGANSQIIKEIEVPDQGRYTTSTSTF